MWDGITCFLIILCIPCLPWFFSVYENLYVFVILSLILCANACGKNLNYSSMMFVNVGFYVDDFERLEEWLWVMYVCVCVCLKYIQLLVLLLSPRLFVTNDVCICCVRRCFVGGDRFNTVQSNCLGCFTNTWFRPRWTRQMEALIE